MLPEPIGDRTACRDQIDLSAPQMFAGDWQQAAVTEILLDEISRHVPPAMPCRMSSFFIREAHRLMESNEANGKIVVRI
jgi:hypothetical protein